MFLFHGSNVEVPQPQIIIQDRFLDFGTGFYTTTNYDQAVNFAQKVVLRRKTGLSIINHYILDEQNLRKTCSVLEFTSANEEWLDFVYKNRSGTPLKDKYDMIIGPVANDDVYRTFMLYSTGFLTKEQTLQNLKVKKLFNQYVFCTDLSLNFLSFQKTEVIK